MGDMTFFVCGTIRGIGKNILFCKILKEIFCKISDSSVLWMSESIDFTGFSGIEKNKVTSKCFFVQ